MDDVAGDSTEARSAGVIQFVVYIATAAFLAYLSANAALLWLSGTKLLLLGVLPIPACILIGCGACLSLAGQRRGRLLAGIGLIILLPLWVRYLVGLVPGRLISASALLYVIIVGYLAVVGFTLYFPASIRLSRYIITAITVLGIVSITAAYVDKRINGYYAPVGIACFRWIPSNSGGIIAPNDPLDWISPSVRDLMAKAGLQGTFEWTGSWGLPNASGTMIVVASKRPDKSVSLPHPRIGTILYVFDGTGWRRFPERIATYKTAATLKTEGGVTFLYEGFGEDVERTQAFDWPK